MSDSDVQRTERALQWLNEQSDPPYHNELARTYRPLFDTAMGGYDKRVILCVRAGISRGTEHLQLWEYTVIVNGMAYGTRMQVDTTKQPIEDYYTATAVALGKDCKLFMKYAGLNDEHS